MGFSYFHGIWDKLIFTISNRCEIIYNNNINNNNFIETRLQDTIGK